jgi:hypothetical protein
MGRTSAYARLTLAQKQLRHLDEQREPAVTCPRCETQTTAADLVRHLEARCPGPREPHPRSRWVSWREAISLGVAEPTMSRWIRRGLVRVRGAPQERQYLLRDLAHHLAERRARRTVGTFTNESGRRRR